MGGRFSGRDFRKKMSNQRAKPERVVVIVVMVVVVGSELAGHARAKSWRKVRSLAIAVCRFSVRIGVEVAGTAAAGTVRTRASACAASRMAPISKP